MNEGCDLDDLREPAAVPPGGRALWQARWFRATVVFSIAAATAAVAVPYALSRAAHRTVWVPVPAPQAGPGAVIRYVSTRAWEGESKHTGKTTPSAGFAAMPTMRVPVIRTASASTPAAPKRAESGTAKGPTASQPPPERLAGAESGELYWVQVGAYREAEMAKRVAQRLREHKYQVRESVTTRPAPVAARTTTDAAPVAQGERDRYEIVVTGGSASEVEAKLRAKGLTSRAVAEGSVITPGLPLGEAVALSKDLADEGLSVRVRRVGAAVAPRAENNAATETLHRVRVGGFADRAAAMSALKELESRGYKPFLTRGNQ